MCFGCHTKHTKHPKLAPLDLAIWPWYVHLDLAIWSWYVHLLVPTFGFRMSLSLMWEKEWFNLTKIAKSVILKKN